MAAQGKKPARAATTVTPRKSGSSGLLAAGAARASGERSRRHSTPLLDHGTPSRSTDASGAHADGGTEPPVTEPPVTEAPLTEPPVTEPTVTELPAQQPRRVHRPQPVAKAVPTRKAVSRSGTRTTRPRPAEPTRRGNLSAVADPVPGAATLTPRTTETSIAPGIEELVTAGIVALRTAGAASGLSPEDVEERVAHILAYLRRRLTGDYTVDEFGFDEDFTESFYLPLLRPLYRSWFRVEVRGLENVPEAGAALIVANHSGTIAFDSLMTQLAIHDEHPAHRHLRMLGADLVFKTPFVGTVARRTGSTLAANTDAERLLRAGELVGVWPEGFKGIGKPFSERYKLQRFGRGGFVSAALRAGAPIVPCSIVGAEEIYPIIGNLKTVARLVGAPYVPVTPTFPWLGLLGLIPLPSKWIIEFGAPVETASLGAGAADDPMLVFDLTDQVRETIQQTLYSLLMKRRSVFF